MVPLETPTKSVKIYHRDWHFATMATTSQTPQWCKNKYIYKKGYLKHKRSDLSGIKNNLQWFLYAVILKNNFLRLFREFSVLLPSELKWNLMQFQNSNVPFLGGGGRWSELLPGIIYVYSSANTTQTCFTKTRLIQALCRDLFWSNKNVRWPHWKQVLYLTFILNVKPTRTFLLSRLSAIFQRRYILADT